MKFKVKANWHHARTGTLDLPHGTIETPVFMPVGTQASVKSLSTADILTTGAEIILGNTYHLYLRPGSTLIKRAGGLHGFTTWQKPFLTDSGGFQVSSLGLFREQMNRTSTGVKAPKIDEDGVTFWSHLDGSEHRFTAEKSIQVQTDLGADIIMAFDEATPDKGAVYAKEAMLRTHRWLLRSIEEWKKQESKKTNEHEAQYLFGIVQGGNYPDLRKLSVLETVKHDLPGIAIGGGSIGSDRLETSKNVDWIREYLPRDKPLYLMGVGVNPEDIIAAILDGADMFDCVAPTRLARTGILYHGELSLAAENKIGIWKEEFDTHPKIYYTSEYARGRINISNSRYKNDFAPLMEACGCLTCTSEYSRAYLHHLYKAKELLYYRLGSIHNLYQMQVICLKMKKFISQFSR